MRIVFAGFVPSESRRIVRTLKIRWPDVEAIEASDEAEVGPMRPDLVFVSSAFLRGQVSLVLARLSREIEAGIVVIAEDGDEEEEIEALRAGADEYIPRDTEAGKLLARVQAVLRRSHGMAEGGEETVARCGPLTVDPVSYETRVGEMELHLTPTEFKMLHCLALNQGRVVTREALHKLVWGCEEKLYIESLRKYIERLRKKLGEAPGGLQIRSVPRVGYKLERSKRRLGQAVLRLSSRVAL